MSLEKSLFQVAPQFSFLKLLMLHYTFIVCIL
jgi:hypothetical protein